MKSRTLIEKIGKFNQGLSDAIERLGENQFCSVDCSVISCDETIEGLKFEDQLKAIKVTDPNCSQEFTIEKDGNNVVDCWDLDEVLDTIKYYNRMIKKTLRVFESENPDKEIEKEDWQIGQETED